jgi:hypothetical protein
MEFIPSHIIRLITKKRSMIVCTPMNLPINYFKISNALPASTGTTATEASAAEAAKTSAAASTTAS